MKILLVDDSKAMRLLQKEVLNQMGFTLITEATDGLQALQKCKATKPDLILLDWNMPNMDGITFLEEFRKVDTDTSVIMVTTEANQNSIGAALKQGITGFIAKPFTPDSLTEGIQKLLPRIKVAS